MPEAVGAVIVDPSSREGLAVKPMELAPASSDDVTVRVTAIAFDRGEVRRATSQGRPGDRVQITLMPAPPRRAAPYCLIPIPMA